MKVTLIQKWIPHYRVTFFDLLRTRLAQHGVTLELLYGRAPTGVPGYDSVSLAWARETRLTRIPVKGRELYWQHVLRSCRGSDLVVVEQANRLLVNYPLLLQARLGGPPVAFWGHGRNFTDAVTPRGAEAVKQRLARAAAWWFAYTDMSRQALVAAGVDPRRITVVNNAVDVAGMLAVSAELSRDDVEVERRRIGLRGGPVGLYIGTLYTEKRLDVLLAAADLVRREVPDFDLVIAGQGDERSTVERAGAGRDWVHVLPAVFGREKVVLLRLADLLLMPGRVGLGVLDSFATGTPMVTRSHARHAPEYAYVADGVNAAVVGDPSPEAFAARIVALLQDDSERERLATGAALCRDEYTIEGMADRFTSGVLEALGQQR